MAYCRFSSDDWRCEVYVYEDCMGGWTTHVAGNRIDDIDNRVPRVTANIREDSKLWLAQYMTQLRALDNVTRTPIDHEHAGADFNDPTPGECADRLEWLRAEGFSVPQHAIDELREEDKGLAD